jgi:UDP-N-acetylglucosamine acyltransferase
MRAHPSAVIEPGARVSANVVIGPFCHIGPQVELADGCELLSHVVIRGATRIGPHARIFPFATIGARSQDMKAGENEGRLVVGAHCTIREGVTINAGTRSGGEETRVGDHCVLLAYCHIAHDCRVGAHVVLSNNVLVGGHVELGDHVVVGGGSAVHQHVRIGAHAFVAGLSGVEGDVPPFALAGGNRAHLFGLNLVGLRRRHFSDERIGRLRQAYKVLFAGAPAPLAERVQKMLALDATDEDLVALANFLSVSSSRPLCAPRARAFAREEDIAF